MSRPAENVVAFYNKRGTCKQWIKEGKGAIKWTRLSFRSFAANAGRLQLHALACNLGNFLRTLATPELIKDWSMTALKENSSGLSPPLVCQSITATVWPCQCSSHAAISASESSHGGMLANSASALGAGIAVAIVAATIGAILLLIVLRLFNRRGRWQACGHCRYDDGRSPCSRS